MKTLDKILWDLYSPNVTMEAFLMGQPDQHLPEKSYECKDCGTAFASVELFSNHFLREGNIIMGCKTLPLVATMAKRQLERPA